MFNSVVTEGRTLKQSICYWENQGWICTSRAAIYALGISDSEADKLFHVMWWPDPYRHEYRLAKTVKEKCDVALARFADFRAAMVRTGR